MRRVIYTELDFGGLDQIEKLQAGVSGEGANTVYTPSYFDNLVLQGEIFEDEKRKVYSRANDILQNHEECDRLGINYFNPRQIDVDRADVAGYLGF